MAKGNVELWLGELLTVQQKSLHGIIRETSNVINDPQFDMLGFINSYICQVIERVVSVMIVGGNPVDQYAWFIYDMKGERVQLFP